MTSKFDDAKNKVSAKSGSTELDKSAPGAIVTRPDEVSVVEPMSMAEFAEAISAGGEMAPSFVEMKENEMFRAFFMDRLDSHIEEIVNGQVTIKPVKRLVFELASKDRKGLGVMFSMLEVTQLEQKIGSALPADGSCFVLVGKGGKKTTAKKRQMDHFEVIAFRGERKPRRGQLLLDEKSGLPLVGQKVD